MRPRSFGPSDFVIVNGFRLAFAPLLATGIAFLLWLHRVCENLEIYRGKSLAFTPGGAVGSFFIPFVNSFGPTR